MRDYFYVEHAPPPTNIERKQVRLSHKGGELMYLKVKLCRKCRHVELYSPTTEELTAYGEKENV